LVTLGVRVEEPLGGRCAVGVDFWLAGLDDGQLGPDVEFELLQEDVLAGGGGHLFSRGAWVCPGRGLVRRPRAAPRPGGSARLSPRGARRRPRGTRRESPARAARRPVRP